MIRTTMAVLFLAALATASPARAGDCKPVHGFYTSRVLPQESCPGALCTAGTLIGGIQGEYAFVASSLTPAFDGATFYTGRSDVALKSGDHVLASDAGVIDLGTTGKQAALLVITGGTGEHEGATGYLQLRGTVSLVTGEVAGDYSGEVCAR